MRTAHQAAWLVAALLSLIAAAAGADEAFEYRLGPTDRIRITVFGHEDLSGEFEIDGTGSVSLPLIRTVEASGLTTNELAATIAAKLRPDYLKDPSVSVDVISYRPFYIIGEVQKPGRLVSDNDTELPSGSDAETGSTSTSVLAMA